MKLATCSWQKYRPEMGTPVRITLGKPPKWFRYPHEEIHALAPPPKVFRIEDEEQFRRAYRHHLYRVTPERLRTIFEALSQKHGGKRLVLLCFEADPAECHRGMFAQWWQEQTGEVVEELAFSLRKENLSRAEQEPLF